MADEIALITDYLANGGLFNPELMEHQKVSDLLRNCRDAIAERDARVAELEQDARRYRWLVANGYFRVYSLDMGGKHTWSPIGRPIRGQGPTLDAAIDEAMSNE